MNSQTHKLNRRQFLQRSTTVVATLSLVPRHVLGGPGQKPPSETVGAALIGCGGRGPGTFKHL